MKLSLTTWQRLALVLAIAEVRGNIKQVRMGLKALDVLELTEAERAEINLQTDGAGNLRWDQPERRWEIEIGDREVGTWLRRFVATHEGWPGHMAREVLDLAEQLGIEE